MSIKIEKFRPSARLLSTIGENLIKDNYAAVVELVKNAYDADASNVDIVFETNNDKMYITIKDDGIGMSPETITKKWLVPSTDNKKKVKMSSKGRRFQGEKGVGRFSAAILGEKLLLNSVNNGILSTMKIDWNDFSENKYLDEIELELNSVATIEQNGTSLEIICEDKTRWWTDVNIEYLIKELRKMLTPVEIRSDDEFNISLSFRDFYIDNYSNMTIDIVPYPLLKFFNYRIYGKVYGDGNSDMWFEYRKSNELVRKDVSRKIEISKDLNYCGDIEFDFKVFEREKDNLMECYKQDEFISSSLNSMNISEIKRLLNRICGISIYKNNFRIRPYGDEGYDWLELDKKRVQDPSHKIGFNQISGIIKIGSEEESGLSEKSARDGLREDSYYNGFKYIVTTIIEILELNRSNLKNEEKKVLSVNSLIDNSSLKEKITDIVQEAGVNPSVVGEIENIIEQEEKSKQKKVEELNNNISKYEGQATLGKIMDLIMHEIRKPLMWFKTQSDTISRIYGRYKNLPNEADLEKMVNIIENSRVQADLISDFFKKIDILATRNNGSKEIFNIYKALTDSISIFSQLFDNNNIYVKLDCNKNIDFFGWEKDIVMAVANILENSIYWLTNYNVKSRNISIKVVEDSKNIIISIEDTGVGISNELLEKGLLFKPGITTKPKGTGMGLAIVGNCIERNNGKVEASNTINGACIKIILSKEK